MKKTFFAIVFTFFLTALQFVSPLTVLAVAGPGPSSDDGVTKRFYSSEGYTTSSAFSSGYDYVYGQGANILNYIKLSTREVFISRLTQFNSIIPGLSSSMPEDTWTVTEDGQYNIYFVSTGTIQSSVTQDGYFYNNVSFFIEIDGQSYPLAPNGYRNTSLGCSYNNNAFNVQISTNAENPNNYQYHMNNCDDRDIHTISLPYVISYSNYHTLQAGDTIRIYGIVKGNAVNPGTFSSNYMGMTFSVSAGSTMLDVKKESSSQTPNVYLQISGQTALTVESGWSGRLDWGASGNAVRCDASGGWSGTRAISGSEYVGPLYQNTTFVVSCPNSDGVAGTASVVVTVNPPAGPPQAPTGFTAVASNACANNWLNLSWNAVSGATSYIVKEGSTVVYSGSGTSTSVTGLVSGSTHTYTVVATNANGTSTSTSATGTVYAACVTASISASPMSVVSGSTTTLTWSSSGANVNGCTASASPSSVGWSGAKAVSGSQVTASLTATTTFYISCAGPGGTSPQASVTVIVTAPGGPSTPTGFTASTSTCGNNWLNLSWSAVSGATSYTVMEGARLVYSGTSTVMSDTGLTPGSTHTYTLTASNSGGTSASTSASGTVSAATCTGVPFADIYSDPAGPIQYNTQHAMWWKTQNVTSCTVSDGGNGVWNGSVTTPTPSDGNYVGQAIVAKSSTTYSIGCTGPNGSVSDSVYVAVTGVPTPSAPTGFTATASNACANNWLNLSWNAVSGATSYTVMEGARLVYSGSGTAMSDTGLVSGSTHTYTVTASNSGGTSATASATGTVIAACSTIVPTVSITTSPTSVTAGGSSQISWSSTNANTNGCTATNGWSGAKATSGSVLTGGLYSTTTYTLACTGPAGTSSPVSATVTVTAAPQPDVCYNISGTQTSAPAGMHEGGDGNCYDDNDLCYNIEDVQYTIPEGMTSDGYGTCTTAVAIKRPWWREF